MYNTGRAEERNKVNIDSQSRVRWVEFVSMAAWNAINKLTSCYLSFWADGEVSSIHLLTRRAPVWLALLCSPIWTLRNISQSFTVFLKLYSALMSGAGVTPGTRRISAMHTFTFLNIASQPQSGPPLDRPAATDQPTRVKCTALLSILSLCIPPTSRAVSPTQDLGCLYRDCAAIKAPNEYHTLDSRLWLGKDVYMWRTSLPAPAYRAAAAWRDILLAPEQMVVWRNVAQWSARGQTGCRVKASGTVSTALTC